MAKIHSLLSGYLTGDLSLYPEAVDTKSSLYEVSNNATTKLKQTLSYLSKTIVVEDATAFPSQGLIRITSEKYQTGELIYYGSRTSNTFKELIRGFAGSRQDFWPNGSTLTNSVSAEHHNAVKDAIIKMEINLGLKENPEESSLNGILKNQENRFLTTKPLFRAFPLKGSPPLVVSFQNFSSGPITKYFWDFGDGNTSTEKNPIHEYKTEGVYSVQLITIGVLGGQGVMTKSNYLTVSETEKIPFFYVKNSPEGFQALRDLKLTYGNSFSSVNPSVFNFVDQTDGDVRERYWNFGGYGKIIKNFYDCEIISNNKIKINDTDLTLEYSEAGADLVDGNGDRYIVLVCKNIDGELLTKIKKLTYIEYIASNNYYTLIDIENDEELASFIQPKIGFLRPNSITTYTEQDPNNHFINIIYDSKGEYSPSVFVLFKDQIIKKAFLKEDVVVQ